MGAHVGLKPAEIETPAVTVNRLCGSGIERCAGGAALAAWGSKTWCSQVDGEYDAGAVCGSRSAERIEAGRRSAGRLVDGGADGYVLWIADGADAEKLAEQHGITRKDADAYALRSQQAADAAYKALPHQGRTCLVE